MGGYNRDRSGGDRGGRSFGGGRSSGRPSFGRGDRDRDNRSQMHRAICAECGDQCEVPFRPTGDKPVFCRDCFDSKGGDNRGNSRGDSFGKDRGGRDRDRDNRGRDRGFDRSERDDAPKDSTKEQLEMLNAKLDRILKLITPVTSVSKEKHAEVLAKTAKAEKPEEVQHEAKSEPVVKAKKVVKKAKKD